MTPTPRKIKLARKAKDMVGNALVVHASQYEKLERENVALRKALELLALSYENPFRVQMTRTQLIAAARSALGEGGSAPEPLPGQKNASTGRTGAGEGSL